MKTYFVYNIHDNIYYGKYSQEVLFSYFYSWWGFNELSYRSAIGHNINDSNKFYLINGQVRDLYKKIHINKLKKKPFIIFDNFLRIVNINEIIDIMNFYKNLNYDFKQNKKSKIFKYEYRCDPVPGIHKYSNTRFYRSQKTINEKRSNCDIEIKDYIRPKRYYKNLIDPWDDYIISSKKDRSWKRTTKYKKQWMKSLK